MDVTPRPSMALSGPVTLLISSIYAITYLIDRRTSLVGNPTPPTLWYQYRLMSVAGTWRVQLEGSCKQFSNCNMITNGIGHTWCVESRCYQGPLGMTTSDILSNTVPTISRVVLHSASSGWLDSDSFDNPGDSTLAQLNSLGWSKNGVKMTFFEILRSYPLNLLLDMRNTSCQNFIKIGQL